MGSPVGGGSSKVKESQSSQALAQIGKEEWERFQTDFAGHEKDYTGDMLEIGSGREADTLAGRSVAELKQQAGPAGSGSVRGLSRRALATGKEQTGITQKSDMQSIARKGRGINAAVGMGRDIATGAMGELSQSSQMETSKNIADASAKNIRDQGKWDLAGTAAGYGMKQGIDYLKTPGGSYNTLPFSEQTRMLKEQDRGI